MGGHTWNTRGRYHGIFWFCSNLNTCTLHEQKENHFAELISIGYDRTGIAGVCSMSSGNPGEVPCYEYGWQPVFGEKYF
jgi:hypothetical protein